MCLQHGDCECQMLGFGVYFADKQKATEFALKRAEPMPHTAVPCGALIECKVHMWLTAQRLLLFAWLCLMYYEAGVLCPFLLLFSWGSCFCVVFRIVDSCLPDLPVVHTAAD